jgi:hypothetical protein
MSKAWNKSSRRWLLASILVATATSAFVLGGEPISGADARDHVGETETVCDRVVDTYYARGSKGRPTFLNFGGKYPAHKFAVVIWGDDRSKFGAPESDLLNKRICVTGNIELHKGKPEIILRKTSQLRVVEQDD